MAAIEGSVFTLNPDRSLMSSLKIFLHVSLLCAALLVNSAACGVAPRAVSQRAKGQSATAPRPSTPAAPQVVEPTYESPVLERLVAAANERTTHEVEYDGSYFKLDYPNGDVPAEKGVCTDEVIRSYRAFGVDLQKEVHEDMKANFSRYPTKFGLRTTDTNIDHRRVPNLRVFFERKGKSLPITDEAADYKPGDIVTWDLNTSQTHIGIVVDAPSAVPGRYMIMHNIGAGPKIEDILFSWKITGHYRYTGPPPAPKTTPAARRATER